jgi:adsorption protein B
MVLDLFNSLPAFAPSLAALDHAAANILIPLAFWILLNALDDLMILAVWLRLVIRRRLTEPPASARLEAEPERAIAIFIPAWKEHAVIGRMLEHNVAAIRYRRCDIFVGVYPNDPRTQTAVRAAAARFPAVHTALCPHDGPTSKADCLNWIYQRMLLYEGERGVRFDLILTHDAEDILHPEELRWHNWFARDYGMVQTPVLAMPTPVRQWTHGIYCDDFAEFHTKDLAVRNALGGFVPSSGVATSFRREAIEQLAERDAKRIFEPACLTEDYENGYRLHKLGVKQLFVPVWVRRGREGRLPVATREYFPQKFGAALRQRTRWQTGIALQGWERHGWGRNWRERYWFWRDRKGLIGNPLSVAANLLFLYGATSWSLSRLSDGRWILGEELAPWRNVLLATAALGLMHLAARMACSARVYGWWFAAFAPLRLGTANVLNSLAAACALGRFVRARMVKRPLVWLKTEHAYPALGALATHKKLLGEVLVENGYLSQEALAAALALRPEGAPLGNYLVKSGLIAHSDLLEALSLQHGVETRRVAARELSRELARSLPRRMVHEFEVLPIGLVAGELQLASPEVPPERFHEELERQTRLGIRYVLVSRENFNSLCSLVL